MVTASPTGPAIEAAGITKRYQSTKAVDGVSLTVHTGDLFGLIGPDGSGKSSLLTCIAGVLAHDGGMLRVLGTAIDSEPAAEMVKPAIGLMPQGLGQNLYGDLSVEENVDYFARTRLVGARELAERKKTLLGLTRLDRFLGRPMKKLSGGMKQKLGLVCTLIHQPRLVLLDEPTTGVDPVSRRDFWKILSELVQEQRITAIVSTASMDEAAYCNRIALMMDGRIEACGTEDDILGLAPGSVVQCRSEAPLAVRGRLETISPQCETIGSIVRVFLPRTGAVATETAAEETVRQTIGDLPYDGLEVLRPGLEDVLVSRLLARRELRAGTVRPAETSATGDAAAIGTAGPEVVIEACDLVRAFGAFRAVDGISFTVRAGEIFGLLGANGAGKTTAIKMLCGMMPPTSGYGRVAGADMMHAAAEIKQRIGYMSQAFSLYLDLTVWENFRLYAQLYRVGRAAIRQRFDELVAEADLAAYAHRRTRSLPMGLRQRLALGCATSHRPQIVFLDEPTSGVDALGRRQFWDQLTRMSRQEGVAVLVTTHFMAEAERCDHMVIMFAGKVFVAGTPTELRADLERSHGRTLSVAVSRPASALDVARRSGFPSAAILNRDVQVPSLDHAADVARLTRAFTDAGIDVGGHRSLDVTMEDVFVQRVLDLERERDSREGRP